MGAYAEGEPEEAAPLRGQATDREIMKQAFESLRDEVMSLKKSLPNGNGSRYSLFKDWHLTPGTSLTIGAIMLSVGTWGWTVNDKIGDIDPNAKKVEVLRKDFEDAKKVSEAERADLKNRVAALEAQNFQYKEDRVKYREGIASQNQVMKDDINELKGQQASLTYRVARLEEGQVSASARMDRAFDIYNKRFDDTKSQAAEMSGDIKVLREQTQRIINWLEARDRNPATPFDRNQTWRGFPIYRIAPFTLRAATSPRSAVQILRVAEN